MRLILRKNALAFTTIDQLLYLNQISSKHLLFKDECLSSVPSSLLLVNDVHIQVP